MIGVVLAGGASARFGGRPKGLISLGGRAMALRVADMLSIFCSRVAIEAPSGAGYDALGLPLVHAPPEHLGKGPLAGLAAGLRLAGGAERAAFAPCDMPFLTRAVYDRLTLTSGDGSGAYARSPKGEEPLVAVLRGDVHAALMAAVAQGTLPRTHKALDAAGVRSVAFDDAAPFSNINTPDDLAAAEARLAQP